jgi:hypothetical protein
MVKWDIFFIREEGLAQYFWLILQIKYN